MDPHFATLWEAIADQQPGEKAVVHGAREVSWGAYDDRAARLAAALQDAGLGPDSKVALYLRNAPEYAEATYAACKIRAVPVNVNYRYLDHELLYLLTDSEAEAVVYGSGLADRIARVAERAPQVRLWIEVDDGVPAPDAARPERAHRYEELVAAYEPAPRITRSGDDRWLLYTGGTTGRPRGVEYRIGTLVSKFLTQLPPMLGLDPVSASAGALAAARTLREQGRRYVALPACPLMHGIGQWRGVLMPHLLGGTSVLLTARSFDPGEVWAAVEAQGVVSIAAVGDPVVRPLTDRLRELTDRGEPPELSSLRLLFSSGAMLSSRTKLELLDLAPGLTLVDAFGASEASAGIEVTRHGDSVETGRFVPGPTVVVLDTDGRRVTPGAEGRGLFAVSGDIAIGYYRDEAKTAEVFRTVDGVRHAVPGDWVHLRADGTALFLGRDSSCVNTGGEKVFPEEVEEVLKAHTAVADCLVIGVPDERFGTRVGAVASLRAGRDADEDTLIEHVRAQLAGYKVPVGIAVVDDVPRYDNGKADHAGARRLWDAGRGGSGQVRPSSRRPHAASDR